MTKHFYFFLSYKKLQKPRGCWEGIPVQAIQ